MKFQRINGSQTYRSSYSYYSKIMVNKKVEILPLVRSLIGRSVDTRIPSTEWILKESVKTISPTRW